MVAWTLTQLEYGKLAWQQGRHRLACHVGNQILECHAQKRAHVPYVLAARAQCRVARWQWDGAAEGKESVLALLQEAEGKLVKWMDGNHGEGETGIRGGELQDVGMCGYGLLELGLCSGCWMREVNVWAARIDYKL